MKKITLLLGIVVLMSTTSVYAQGGQLGEDLFWKLNNDTLTISGNGDIPNFTAPPFSNPPPWCDFNTFGNLVIENGVTAIGDNAFGFNHMLTSVSIGNGVVKIGSAAFIRCGSLSSITLPKRVSSIGEAAFAECISLTSITNLNPIPQIVPINVFVEVNISICTLYVPKNSVSAYKKAPVWREFNVKPLELVIDEYSEVENGEQLLIYPNPTTGTCSIVIPETFQNERFLTLSVYDNYGKLIQQITIDNANQEYSINLDIKAAGAYVAVLSNGKRSMRGRIVFN